MTGLADTLLGPGFNSSSLMTNLLHTKDKQNKLMPTFVNHNNMYYIN